MSKAAARHDTPADAGTATSPAPKRAKIAAFLVTGDVELWPQVARIFRPSSIFGKSIPSTNY